MTHGTPGARFASYCTSIIRSTENLSILRTLHFLDLIGLQRGKFAWINQMHYFDLSSDSSSAVVLQTSFRGWISRGCNLQGEKRTKNLSKSLNTVGDIKWSRIEVKVVWHEQNYWTTNQCSLHKGHNLIQKNRRGNRSLSSEGRSRSIYDWNR